MNNQLLIAPFLSKRKKKLLIAPVLEISLYTDRRTDPSDAATWTWRCKSHSMVQTQLMKLTPCTPVLLDESYISPSSKVPCNKLHVQTSSDQNLFTVVAKAVGMDTFKSYWP